jgi:hypothetical protein
MSIAGDTWKFYRADIDSATSLPMDNLTFAGGFDADLAPRQVMQAHLPQLPLIHGQRMLARRPGQLIGDRQDRVTVKPCSRATSR